MAKTKVWNRNKFEHRETFKGSDLVIPAGEYIEMEFEEAIEFKGQWRPMPPEDYSGDPAKFYKMIVVEWPKVHEKKANSDLICHADGSVSETREQLLAKLRDFDDLRVKDDELDKVTQRPNPELEALKAELESIKALMSAQNQRRGPGRPRKDEAASA